MKCLAKTLSQLANSMIADLTQAVTIAAVGDRTPEVVAVAAIKAIAATLRHQGVLLYGSDRGMADSSWQVAKWLEAQVCNPSILVK